MHHGDGETSDFGDTLTDDTLLVVEDEEARKWMERPAGAPLRRGLWRPLTDEPGSRPSGSEKAGDKNDNNSIAVRDEGEARETDMETWLKHLNPLEDIFVSHADVSLYPAERMSQCLRHPASFGDLSKAIGLAFHALEESEADSRRQTARERDPQGKQDSASSSKRADLNGYASFIATAAKFGANDRKGTVEKTQLTVSGLLRDLQSRVHAAGLRLPFHAPTEETRRAGAESASTAVTTVLSPSPSFESASYAERGPPPHAKDTDFGWTTSFSAGLPLRPVPEPPPSVVLPFPLPSAKVLRQATKRLAEQSRCPWMLFEMATLSRSPTEKRDRERPSDGEAADTVSLFPQGASLQDFFDLFPSSFSSRLHFSYKEEGIDSKRSDSCFSAAVLRAAKLTQSADLGPVSLHPVTGLALLIQQEAVVSQLLGLLWPLASAKGMWNGKSWEPRRETTDFQWAGTSRTFDGDSPGSSDNSSSFGVAPISPAFAAATVLACFLETEAGEATPAGPRETSRSSGGGNEVSPQRCRDVALGAALKGAALHSALLLATGDAASAKIEREGRHPLAAVTGVSSGAVSLSSALRIWVTSLPVSVVTSFFPETRGRVDPQSQTEVESKQGGADPQTLKQNDSQNLEKTAANMEQIDQSHQSRTARKSAEGLGRNERRAMTVARFVLDARVASPIAPPQLSFVAPSAFQSWNSLSALAASLGPGEKEESKLQSTRGPLRLFFEAPMVTPGSLPSAQANTRTPFFARGFDPTRDTAIPPVTVIQLASLTVSSRRRPATHATGREERPEWRQTSRSVAKEAEGACELAAAFLLHLVPWVLLPEVLSSSPLSFFGPLGDSDELVDDPGKQEEREKSLKDATQLADTLARSDGPLGVETAEQLDEQLRQTLNPVSVFRVQRMQRLVAKIVDAGVGGSPYVTSFSRLLSRHSPTAADELGFDELTFSSKERGNDENESLPRMRGTQKSRKQAEGESPGEQAEGSKKRGSGDLRLSAAKKKKPRALLFGRREFDVVLFSPAESRGPLTHLVLRDFQRATEMSREEGRVFLPFSPEAGDAGGDANEKPDNSGKQATRQDRLEFLDLELMVLPPEASNSRTSPRNATEPASEQAASNSHTEGFPIHDEMVEESVEARSFQEATADEARRPSTRGPENTRKFRSWMHAATKSFFISRATFCLCPQEGWLPSMCIFEAVAHACIPVIIGGEEELWLPGGCLFDWIQMAVFVPLSRAPYTSLILALTPDNQVLEKQQMLWKVRQHFLYDLSLVSSTGNHQRKALSPSKAFWRDALNSSVVDAGRLALLETLMRSPLFEDQANKVPGERWGGR
ncbi:exostosin family protein [Toxoplasma gondii VEG]|uniref:Exostosin family protein n=2 Tax=Toxoplasma gondii (strain ATCC 50861 / VEG) TaxID=432359 RepID=V4ZJW0_TOXGV|nr:exostosin family protein [Toxoplasma gondii VEG]